MVFDTFIRYVAKAYSPYSLLFHLLDDTGNGHHQISIVQKDPENPAIKQKYEVSAYHIDFVDWVVLKTTALRDMYDEFNDEGREFLFYSFLEDPNKVPLPKCRTPFWLSTDTSVDGNCIDANADCNGTMVGSRAERNYYFWLEDFQKYAVLKMKYFIL